MSFPQTNLILDCLSPPSRKNLLALCEEVSMPVQRVLFEPGETPQYVHFLTSGVASVVTPMAEGDSLEVGLVGREGVAECLHLLGPQPGSARCFMQIKGAGLRIRFKRFQQEFEQNAEIRGLVLQYVQYEALVLNQLAACNRLHAVEERFARWLLMAQDKIDDKFVDLTQEFFAQMLGSRRSTVTLVAGTMQRAGLIEYKRGHVHILRRKGLESTTCECYPIIHKLTKNLYGPPA